MLRSDLFALAKKAGWKPEKPLNPKIRAAVDAAIREALTQDTASMARAPIVSTDAGMRPMSIDEATRALMEEFA